MIRLLFDMGLPRRACESQLTVGSVVSVTEDQIRVRLLPIGGDEP